MIDIEIIEIKIKSDHHIGERYLSKPCLKQNAVAYIFICHKHQGLKMEEGSVIEDTLSGFTFFFV